jgi:hypothetical protein
LVKQVIGSDNGIKKYRPASYLLPVLEDAKTPDFVDNQQDMLLHLLLGVNADAYLKKEKGFLS